MSGTGCRTEAGIFARGSLPQRVGQKCGRVRRVRGEWSERALGDEGSQVTGLGCGLSGDGAPEAFTVRGSR